MERWKILIMAILLCSCVNANTLERDLSSRRETKVKANVIRKVLLPDRLKEISALVYLDTDRFACVQDEEGIIFVYNAAANVIEKEIAFAGPGDYEGLAYTKKEFYVLRSDGHLFEVSERSKSKPAVKEHNTALTQEQDSEGLCYDAKNNRLLIAVKAKDPHSNDYKGIYAFNLRDKRFSDEPVFKIQMQDEIFKQMKAKKTANIFRPSDMTIDPIEDDIYITDGTASRMLILDARGSAKTLIDLGDEFAQPEGISFDPKGRMFISNEGQKKSPGNILEVEVTK